MIIGKTLEGQRVLKDRSVALTPRQRAAFVMVDGKRSVDEILSASAKMGVTRADIDRLVELGLVAEISKAAAMQRAQEAKLEAKRNSRSPEERYEAAYPIATLLTSSLGLGGYRLNLQVEGARNYMELLALAPRIREAVGDTRYAMLDQLLHDD
ncbi:MAG TPA: hypothetical protein VHA82_11340 [Ramlibacter sp.]|uniref:hypothetical protein n=1 Tax=Ramlibacter sp. TaxID=1917967 RepID=UPI002BD845E1|nr:hypothetical protein [Ramlibacter sp.]HVZ44395.1 hypothetical protein [Ramlibacter sp.]